MKKITIFVLFIALFLLIKPIYGATRSLIAQFSVGEMDNSEMRVYKVVDGDNTCYVSIAKNFTMLGEDRYDVASGISCLKSK